MAKLYFRKSAGTAARSNLVGILADNESSVNDNFFITIDISTSDYNNFVSFTKDFTVGTNNTLTWSDTGSAKDQNDDDISQTEAMYQDEINYLKDTVKLYKESSEGAKGKESQIDSYISQLDAIDTSTITFPFSGNMAKDIASKCSDSIHPMCLTITRSS